MSAAQLTAALDAARGLVALLARLEDDFARRRSAPVRLADHQHALEADGALDALLAAGFDFAEDARGDASS